ncbi:MAG: Zn-ribbon domain-containing OB-fold protein [Candidatus Thermoplasmatota archaeon]|nr:Zn-ribbon domain-containing OB-fold protein [Candidatus Thermoplasmatota archaeon]
MKTSTEKAKETARKELKSEPLENVIDSIIAGKLERNSSVLEREKYFEIPDKMVMFYKYSYGMQSKFFRELMDNAMLYGTKCRGCGIVHFPPRIKCSECYSDTEWIRVSDRGTVLSGTTSWYATSEFFDKVPYAVAYVKPVDADTAILQRIDLKGREHVESGTAVKARYKDKEARRGTVSDFWYEIEER